MNKKSVILFITVAAITAAVCFILTDALFGAESKTSYAANANYGTGTHRDAEDYPWSFYDTAVTKSVKKSDDLYYYLEGDGTFGGFVSCGIEIANVNVENAVLKSTDSGFTFVTGVTLNDTSGTEFCADIALKNGRTVSVRISGKSENAAVDAKSDAEEIMKEFYRLKISGLDYVGSQYDEYVKGNVYVTQSEEYAQPTTKLLSLAYSLYYSNAEIYNILSGKNTLAETITENGFVYLLAESTSGSIVLKYDSALSIWCEITVCN